MNAAAEPKTLQQAILHFSDYENCRAAVEAVRWTDGKPVCPHCGSERVAYLAKQRRYKCYEGHARAQFSLKVGTIFEDSAIGFEKWLPALWLLTNCKNGISSYELARALGAARSRSSSSRCWLMTSSAFAYSRSSAVLTRGPSSTSAGGTATGAASLALRSAISSRYDRFSRSVSNRAWPDA